MAYFQLARKYHPDTNPDDAQAKARFLEISDAYAYLTNKPTSGNTGFGSGFNSASGSASNSSGYSSSGGPQYDPFGVFDDMLKDVDVAGSIMGEYLNDLQEDIAHVSDEVKIGHYDEIWDFAKRRKGLVVSTFVPLLLVFRMPALAMAALAFVPRITMMLVSVFHSLPQKQKQSFVLLFLGSIRKWLHDTRDSSDTAKRKDSNTADNDNSTTDNNANRSNSHASSRNTGHQTNDVNAKSGDPLDANKPTHRKRNRSTPAKPK